MSSLLAEANQIRVIQAAITDQALLDLGQLMSLVEDLPPVAGRNLLLDTLPALSDTYGDLAATAAGEWFEDLRTRHVGSGRASVRASTAPAAKVEGSVRYSARHLFDGDPAAMGVYLQGALRKWVAQPARETIIDSIDADPIGYGWQRVVRPSGCTFCIMLADRGGVYTRKSVYFASHNNCNCGVVPSWDPSLPEVDVMAYQASRRMEAIRVRAYGDATDQQIRNARAAAGGRRTGTITRQDRKDDQARAQRILEDWRRNVREWTALFETNPT